MKKRILVSVVLFLALIIFAIMYINNNHKRISEIGGFQVNDITKISFQYINPAIKGGTVENKENINEFMNYINSCVFTKQF